MSKSNAKLDELVNKSQRCLIAFGDGGVEVILWFGGDTVHGYDKDGNEVRSWPVSATKGEISKRVVQRALQDAYSTLL